MINHPTSQPLKYNHFHLRAALLYWAKALLSTLIKPSYAPPTPPSDNAVTVAIILVVRVSGFNQLYGTCLESYCSKTRVGVSWKDVFIHGVQTWQPVMWSVCLLICAFCKSDTVPCIKVKHLIFRLPLCWMLKDQFSKLSHSKKKTFTCVHLGAIDYKYLSSHFTLSLIGFAFKSNLVGFKKTFDI